MSEWLARLRDRFQRGRLDAELGEELRFHHESLTRDGGAGAARRLGNLTQLKEDTRDMWSFRWLDELGQDVRYTMRSFRRTPGFTAAAVLTLALGVGATTAILSVVNGVLIRPLPYPNADRAVLVWTGDPRSPGTNLPFSLPDFVDLRQESKTLEQVAAFRSWNFTLAEQGEPEQLAGANVSPGLFEVLGVRPALGRTFARDEEQAGGVVIISDRLWRRRFGSDPALLGRSVVLNGVARTVIGVMPPGFHFPRGAELPSGFQFGNRTDLWAPLETSGLTPQLRGQRNLAVAALPRAGVDRAAVDADLGLVMRSLAERYPNYHAETTMRGAPILETAVAPVKPTLLVLLGAVGFLLLIACVNVSSLLLTRTEARRREIAVRTAIGAGSGRLTRQFFTENLVLAIVGGGLGALVAVLTKQALLNLAPIDLPRLDDVVIDWRVLSGIIALVAAIGTGLGALVASETRHADRSTLLRDGTRGSAGPKRHRARNGLVVLQVAVSVVLLAGAALLAQTLRNLQNQDPGFAPAGIISAKPILPVAASDFSRFLEASVRWRQVYRQAIDELAARPGIVQVAAISSLPLSGAWESNAFTVAGRPPLQAHERQFALFAGVSEQYFQTLRIPLVRGRYFDATDRDSSAASIIISEAAARAYWPNEDPIGARVEGMFGPPVTVVGIVGDVRHRDMVSAPVPMMYLPMSRYTTPAMTLVVRGEGAQAGTIATIRDVVRRLDPSVPVTAVAAVDDIVAESVARQRFSTILIGGFSLAAVVLAVLGLYGVISYSVAQRGKELGIRLALGAAPASVRRLVMKEGLTLAIAGTLLGLATTLLLGRTLTTLVYGVSPSDPLTLAGVTLLLLGVATVATFIPARRATRIDVVSVLRDE
ncbi:MAG: ABC transporter permease [Gemmatimonadales bacterium]|nr:ABC transporter permease [Gemmatimonadales bacterium]